MIRYREMAAADVVAASRLRAAAGGGDALPALGPAFWRLFLTGVVAAPDALAFVALGSEGEPAGYAIITPDAGRMHAQILAGRRLAFFVTCLHQVLARPSALPGLLAMSRTPPGGAGEISPARWVTVVVAPEYRRRGIARVLFGLVSSALYARGVAEFHSPVEVANEASNALQSRLGGRRVGSVRLLGRLHDVWSFRSAPLPPLPPGHQVLTDDLDRV